MPVTVTTMPATGRPGDSVTCQDLNRNRSFTAAAACRAGSRLGHGGPRCDAESGQGHSPSRGRDTAKRESVCIPPHRCCSYTGGNRGRVGGEARERAGESSFPTSKLFGHSLISICANGVCAGSRRAKDRRAHQKGAIVFRCFHRSGSYSYRSF